MSFQLRDQHETIEKMNKDLLSIRNWCFDNQLLLNPDKTKLVIFGSRQMTAKRPCNTTQTNLDKLQAVQNFACRILSGAKNSIT
ncbi:unnamed protein product [Porites lobata]|uniref:Reverse transcriptase n=1 Tax=Porites lobata TaxID=104759 RepID=A0ABN8NVJ6_9CNID|nr:unnamed protein product [Porites lobata]